MIKKILDFGILEQVSPYLNPPAGTHKMTHEFTNRLIHQKSPYLLQHAHNPVDWYPWGEEAFKAAEENDKPIFLSIGYASCHWCHVMEKESFENSDIARQLNNTFINVKVDREELPEIDSLYMEFAQSMMTGAAGWPLNLILTPKLVPIFASTYMPPQERNGMMGLEGLIDKIDEIWEGDERPKIIEQADKVLEFFSQAVHSYGDELPDEQLISETSDILLKMGDSVYGGINKAPKFPLSYQYDFLMNDYALKKEFRALFFVERSLEMMARGGIRDHLGGGFSRYSVDERWFLPHFEKMLYDNAIIASTYFQAWQLTGKDLYYGISKEILDYVLRELTHGEGGFYSAEDADSEGEEGLYYTWTFEEIQNILGDKTPLFASYYSILPEGNFEGRNILFQKESLTDYSQHYHVNLEELKQTLDTSKALLFKQRNLREHPLKDDKILVSWNGLMIHAMAEFGATQENPIYLKTAENAAYFILKNMVKEGKLLHRYRGGEALYNAGLDDYAFLIKGLLTLFNVSGTSLWLKAAIDFSQLLHDFFKAPEGGYFQTDGLDKNVILRKTQFSDGAEPSGNAIQTENLLRLYQITSEDHYLNDAEDVLCAANDLIEQYSPGYCYHMINLQRFYHSKSPVLFIALNREKDYFMEIRKAIFSRFIPFVSVVWIDANDHVLEQLVPSAGDKQPQQDQTTLYVCYEGACQPAIIGLDKIIEAIEKL